MRMSAYLMVMWHILHVKQSHEICSIENEGIEFSFESGES